jgi:hypothetical protein
MIGQPMDGSGFATLTSHVRVYWADGAIQVEL